MKNPWGPPERAAAREDAIFDQLMAEAKRTREHFATDRLRDRYLEKQFGNPAVKTAIMTSLMRRQQAKQGE